MIAKQLQVTDMIGAASASGKLVIDGHNPQCELVIASSANGVLFGVEFFLVLFVILCLA